jgi:serine/threonine-protein kinase
LAQDLLIGRQIDGRYTLTAAIGRGGMGKVYKAVQAPLNRVVALKVLSPYAGREYDPGFEKRFFLEASVTAKLSHPNIVTIFDYGRTKDEIFYLVMEYLEGQVLSQVVSERGPIAWQRAVSLAVQVARSIRHAHRQGVMHRDLKSANIMVTVSPDGEDLVKVLDFGLVKFFGADRISEEVADLTQAGILLGSPGFVAPEQARNLSVGPRADIYSLGVVLWHMLVGRIPFKGNTPLDVILKQINELPGVPSAANPAGGIPPELDAMVLKMLQKDPDRRYQSMDEVISVLKTIAGIKDPSFTSGVLPSAPPLLRVDMVDQVEITCETDESALPPQERPVAQVPRTHLVGLTIAGLLFLIGGMAVGYLIVERNSQPRTIAPAPITEPSAPTPVPPVAQPTPLPERPPEQPANPAAVPVAEQPTRPEALPATAQPREPTSTPTPTPIARTTPTKPATLAIKRIQPTTPGPKPVDAPPEPRKPDPQPVVAIMPPPPAYLPPVPTPTAAVLNPNEPTFQDVEVVRKRRIAGTEPAFPATALRNEEEGVVVARIVISPEGQITDIKVLQTHPAFEKSVRDALAAWRFKPHLVNGKPASVYTVLRFTFKIE